MIKITFLENNKFRVQYNGTNNINDFNRYIFILNSYFKNQIKPDIKNKGWILKYKYLEKIQRYFNDIEYINSYTPPVYNNIGDMMKLKPFDYQKECIHYAINHTNTLLVCPCGAGKSCIMIGSYLEAINNNIINGQGLIIVKASLKEQWKKEVSKFSELSANILRTYSDICSSYKNKINKLKKQLDKLPITDKENRSLLKAEIKSIEEKSIKTFNSQFDKQYDLLIANFETLSSDEKVLNKLKEMNINFIAIDEIQYCKNHKSKRSKAIYELNNAKFKIGATATPITKNPLDIYGIFKFINPDILDTESKFNSRFVKYAGYGRINGFKNMDKLRNLISNNILVKTKYEIADQLPALQVIPINFDLNEDQLIMNEKIMQEIEELNNNDFIIRNKCKSEQEARLNSELQEISGKIMALQTFAQELTDSPLLLATSESDYSKSHAQDINLNSNPKLDICLELINQIIDSGEKVCIFSKFERMQKILTDAINKNFKDIGICYVNGSLNSEQRYDEVYNKFKNNDYYKILLLSEAGAEGLNLSSCKYMIEYDLAGSYALQTQRHGRLERADSIHSNVVVYQLIANNSWDEIALKIIDKKKNFDNDVIQSLANK